MATFQLHHQTLVTIQYQSTRQDESNELKLEGLRRLLTEFLWPPSSSIIRPWLPYSIKILIQTSSNSRGLRRLITEFLWHLRSIIRPWLPYSIKILVKSIQTSPNSMGLRRLITEFYGHLPAPSSDPGYHTISKYSSRQIKRAQTRGIASFNWFLATFQLHHQTLVTMSIKILVKTNQTSSNSRGLRRLIAEFLWSPSSSIIRPWLPYNIKVLVKTNQTSSNSRGLRRLIAEFLWLPSSSIIRPWLPYSIKILVKTNQTSSNSRGLRRLITEFLWPPSSSIIRSALCHNIALSSDLYMHAKYYFKYINPIMFKITFVKSIY
ncbi:hypothetical protein EVAR_71551_1 [Eumeta japonica]|uniref:Uncharacterized protein n=1 Tax=Eumeta variegata TaxID=151549 RepID=A0A4C1T349_EUMVA|nr:hypothetical protein EVAR_71551_1 [Eumeta japonica]